MVFGLTGNIGCGKSTLSNILKENNIYVVDLDLISREIMNDKFVIDLIYKTFGENLKQKDGLLNRKELGKIVFKNKEKLQLLNNITHPVIKEKVKKIIKQKDLVVIDGALLIEANFLDIVDKLILVTCDEKIQLERIIKRDNLTKEEAMLRINSQMCQQKKKDYADYIIDNSTTKEDLTKKSCELLKFIKEKNCVK